MCARFSVKTRFNPTTFCLCCPSSCCCACVWHCHHFTLGLCLKVENKNRPVWAFLLSACIFSFTKTASPLLSLRVQCLRHRGHYFQFSFVTLTFKESVSLPRPRELSSARLGRSGTAERAAAAVWLWLVFCPLFSLLIWFLWAGTVEMWFLSELRPVHSLSLPQAKSNISTFWFVPGAFGLLRYNRNIPGPSLCCCVSS